MERRAVIGVAFDLLAEAHRRGVELVPTPVGTIKARAPQPPPPEFLARLKAHRDELLVALSARATAETDAIAERAEIIEHDPRAARHWAEAIARLDPSSAPLDVP